jgi:hypothetical protein
MAANEIHVNDVGIIFESTVHDEAGNVLDVSSATVKDFIFEKPDKTSLNVDASFVSDGRDGKLRYISGPGDLNLVGTYRYQVYLEFGSAVKHTDINKFRVLANVQGA